LRHDAGAPQAGHPMGRADPLDPVEGFPGVYAEYHAAVYRTIRAVVLNAAVAEELAQETFMRAYKARESYRPDAPVGAWLHRIAVNLAISHLRRERLSRLLPIRLGIPGPPDLREQVEARTLVEEALGELSPKLRAAVVLHYFHGFTRDEVAAILGVPSGTVASRIAKSLVVMREKLSGNEQKPIPVRTTSHGVA